MVTAIADAAPFESLAFADGAAITAGSIRIAPLLRHEAAMLVQSAGGAALPGVNAQDFIAANRIHIKDASLFIDPYLVIHPRELAPENEAFLRKKLQLTYSINNPSFFESRERRAVALALGQLLPVSTAAKHSKLLEEVKQFNTQVDTGRDAELQKELDDKRAPFAAVVHDVTQHPEADPVGVEMLKNSLALYLLVREKLTLSGYLGKLTDYTPRTGTPDQVLADLAEKTGVSPITFREVALRSGIDGVGALLGLDPLYIADVKALTEYASTQDFGYNIIEHWHLGRQLQGLGAPMAEKIAVGMDARITAKIDEYRARVHRQFDVPEPVKKEQQRIADDALNLLEPIQRALYFKLGGEICYSPEVTADDIAFHPGIYGLNRKAANDLRDVLGTYRIYVAGRGDLKQSRRTFVHEFAHVFWPEQFTPADVQKIDQLVTADQQRFGRFEAMMDAHFLDFEKLFNAYKVATPSQKQAIIATADERFAPYGFHAEGLFPYLRDAHDFRYAVRHAFETLSIEGARYNRSGYNSPQERFREVVSRFAELTQVEYRGEPQFLQFLAPGLNQVWEAHYLPHLTRVYQGIENGTIKPVYTAPTKPQQDMATDPAVAHGGTPQPPVPAPLTPTVPTTPPTAIPTVQASMQDTAPLTTVNNAALGPALNALVSMGVNV